SKCRFKLRQDGEQVTDQPDVGHFEDRRVAVLVDGDDGAGVLDAGQVLDGAGNAHGDVQVRGDDLAGLADLHVAGYVAGIYRGAGGTDGGTELVGQLVDHLEVLLRADTAAT